MDRRRKEPKMSWRVRTKYLTMKLGAGAAGVLACWTGFIWTIGCMDGRADYGSTWYIVPMIAVVSVWILVDDFRRYRSGE